MEPPMKPARLQASWTWFCATRDTRNAKDMILLRPSLFTIRALEGLTVEGEERDIMRDIRKGNREGAREDAVARAAQELKKSAGKSLRSAEWRESQDLLYFRDRIYVPKNADLRRRIVEQHHDTQIAGHAGRWKTLELVSRYIGL